MVPLVSRTKACSSAVSPRAPLTSPLPPTLPDPCLLSHTPHTFRQLLMLAVASGYVHKPAAAHAARVNPLVHGSGIADVD